MDSDNSHGDRRRLIEAIRRGGTTRKSSTLMLKDPGRQAFEELALLMRNALGGRLEGWEFGAGMQLEDERISPLITGFELTPTPPRSELKVMSTILDRSVLYSNSTICIVPVSLGMPFESAEHQSVDTSWNRQLQYWEKGYDVLDLNFRYSKLVEAGKILFLPRSLVWHTGGYNGGDRAISTSAPMVQEPALTQLVPINATLRHSAYHQMLVYKQLVLPYFPQASLEEVNRIAEDETDAFILFNQFMTTELNKLRSISSLADIDEIMAQIDEEVARITIQARRVSNSGLLGNIDLAFFTLSLAVAVTSVGGEFKDVAGVAGSVTLLEVIKERMSRRKESLSLKASQFYVPYILRGHRWL
jgi:hypothetical protein